MQIKDVEPDSCPQACPGCAHRELTLTESLVQKETFLKRALAAWSDRIAPICYIPETAHGGYRRDISLTTHWDLLHGWQMGLIKKNIFIPISRCPVHAPAVTRTWLYLADKLPSPDQGFPMVFYIQTGRQVVLVVKRRSVPDSVRAVIRACAAELMKTGLIDGLWIHCFPSAGKRITTKPGWSCFGLPWSYDADGFRYGPITFRQQVPSLHTQSLDAAEQFLSPDAGSLVIDLYCGAGTSLRRWQNKGATAVGAEQNGEAVACATRNAPEAIVYQGACAQRLPQLADAVKNRGTSKRLLYMNPPRTGLEPAVVQWILDVYRPIRSAYLSCSAGTLCRDLNLLTAHGCQVTSIIPYDFFPRTHHVETLVLYTFAPV